MGNYQCLACNLTYNVNQCPRCGSYKVKALPPIKARRIGGTFQTPANHF